jgi:hypothetical protein
VAFARRKRQSSIWWSFTRRSAQIGSPLLMQLEKEVTGAYADPDDFTLD